MTPPTRGVRRRLDEDQRCAQIVAGAVAVLAEVGYADASLTRIAQEAGVSKGLLWHYFTDRDDLMEQVARTLLRDIRDELAAQIDLTQPVPAIVREGFRRCAALDVTHRAELAALDHVVHNLRQADGSLRLSMRDYEETYQAQEGLFTRGQAEGTVRRDLDVRALAVAYQGAVDTMLGYLRSHQDVDRDALADALAEVFLGGVTVPG